MNRKAESAREPSQGSWRLNLVRHPKIALMALLFAAAAPASAQTSPVTLTASAANNGFVEPYQPVHLEVTVTADVLFAGRIAVTVGQSTIQVSIDVPAGTTKTIPVLAPSVVGASNIRVSLIPDGEEEAIATQSVPVRFLGRAVLVAVEGSRPAAERVLARTRTAIADLPVEVVRFDPAVGPLRPVQFAVAETWNDVLAAWVAGGGRAIFEGTAPDELLASAAGSVEGGTLYTLGAGEVLALSDLPADPAVWARLLLPYELASDAINVWGSPETSLAEVAGNSGNSGVPSMPWLGTAVILYALIVGPVNLLVLRRMKKRELAWATIPVISMLALGVFWMAGRNRLTTLELTHATVVVANPGDTDARTTVLLAAGESGEHRLRLPDGWLGFPTMAFGNQGMAFDGVRAFEFDVAGDMVVPIDPAMPISEGAGPVMDASGDFIFNLPRLGFGALHALYDDPQMPSIAVRMVGDEVVLDITNSLGTEISAYGLVGTEVSPIIKRHLAAGASDTVRSSAAGNLTSWDLADQIMQGGNLWNEGTVHNWLWALSQAVGRIDGYGKSYAFAWMPEYPLSVSVDGVSREATGPALLVFSVTVVGTERLSYGTMVSAGSGWVDGDSGYRWVSQADELILRFDVPEGTSADGRVVFTGGMGIAPQVYQMWDWEQAAFVSIVPKEIDLAPFVSAAGAVYLRLMAAEEGQFFDMEMLPTSVRLEW